MNDNIFFDETNTYAASNDQTITTYEKDFGSSSILGVEVGSTGFQGSDSRHILAFKNKDCSSFKIQVKDDKSNTMFCSDTPEEIYIEFSGENQLEDLVDALNFAVDVLERIAEKELSRY